VTAPEETRVTLARLVRPQGRKGEVAAEILTDFPDRLTKLTSVFLWNGCSTPRPTPVRSCWLSHSHGGQAIFHFEGSDSINDAERLVGLEVQVPLSARVELPEGSYFVTDLIGCTVREAFGEETREAASEEPHATRPTSPPPLGHVTGLLSTGASVAGTPILEVQTPTGEELLIPLAAEICVHIDPASRTIKVRLPEGLRGLNPRQ
jgi:16S rRNA processing protein RimM